MFSIVVLLSTVTPVLGQIVPMNTFPFPTFGGSRLQMPMGYTNPQGVQRVPQKFSGDNMMNPSMNSQFNMPSNQLPSSFLNGRVNMPSMNTQFNMPQRQFQSPQMSMPSMNSQMSMPSMNSQMNMPQGQLPSAFMNPQMNMPSMNSQFNMRPRQLAAPMSFQNDAQQSGSSSSSSSESLPEFLQGVDENIISEFKSIIRQAGISYEAKIKQVEATILPKLDNAHKNLYQKFMSESDQTQLSKRQVINQTVGEMSQDAQQEFSKITEILQNTNLQEEEKWNKITDIYNNLNSNLKNEFEKKFEPLV